VEVFPRDSSHRFSKCRWRMFRKKLIFVIDLPGTVEELSDFHFSLCIRSSIWAWRNIQDQSSDPNGIVIADGRAIAEADDSIQIEILGDLSPGLLGIFGTYPETVVEASDKAFQEDIGLFKGMDAF
jgi:hypothetical protein